jgi:hypothetical protein
MSHAAIAVKQQTFPGDHWIVMTHEMQSEAELESRGPHRQRRNGVEPAVLASGKCTKLNDTGNG